MAANIDKEDSIITEFLKSLGPWKRHIVIGGGYALIIYRLYLAGSVAGNLPVGTKDIDSLIPRKISGNYKQDISYCLKHSGFTCIFKDLEDPATETYVKEIEGTEIEIDFLTDNATRHNKNKNVCIAGIVAQSLAYLEQGIRYT